MVSLCIKLNYFSLFSIVRAHVLANHAPRRTIHQNHHIAAGIVAVVMRVSSPEALKLFPCVYLASKTNCTNLKWN